MTIEEALEVHKKSRECNLTDEFICLNTECPKCALNVTEEQYNEAARMAIEALEKQIPHKMTAEERSDWRCPVCRAYIYGVQDKYCPHCGQALDWS